MRVTLSLYRLDGSDEQSGPIPCREYDADDWSCFEWGRCSPGRPALDLGPSVVVVDHTCQVMNVVLELPECHPEVGDAVMQ